MGEPQWLAEATVLDSHRQQMDEHGGLQGVRDANLLSSALHRPRQLWHYAKDSADLAALAAAYAAGISRNHPFFDGNKRTALVACETFLALNGHELIADNDEVYRVMIRLASGQLHEDALAEWIRERIVRVP